MAEKIIRNNVIGNFSPRKEKIKHIKVGKMMNQKPYKIHVYRCVNVSCRHIEERGDFPRSTLTCPRCGKRMLKIGERFVPEK